MYIHTYIDSGKCIPLYTYTCTFFYEGFDASDMANSTITSGFLGVQMGDGPHHMVQKKYGKLVALGIPYFRTKPIVLPARKNFPKVKEFLCQSTHGVMVD